MIKTKSIYLLIILLVISILSVSCLSIFSRSYSIEELKKRYPADSEQMFWIERYGVPDEIIIRINEEQQIKYETFLWRKGTEDEIWIQFENDKATLFSFL